MTRFFVLCLLALTACTASAETETLTVFAAASLTDAFTELAAAFEATRPGVAVDLNFAGSQALRLQVEQGARADVFASANEAHLAALVEAGLSQPAAPFAANRLAIIVPADNPGGVQQASDLARPGLKIVLAGEAVPVGRYARQVLANLDDGAGFAERVLANVVSEEENVKAVLAKVRLGEADAGLVYASEVTPAVAASVRVLALPPPANVVARYFIAPLSDRPLARAFTAFVHSAEGQRILAQHGFEAVD